MLIYAHPVNDSRCIITFPIKFCNKLYYYSDKQHSMECLNNSHALQTELPVTELIGQVDAFHSIIVCDEREDCVKIDRTKKSFKLTKVLYIY